MALLLMIKKLPRSKRYAGKLGAGTFSTGDTLKTHHTSACVLLVAILATGCGGGGSAGTGGCSIGSTAGCGGTLPPPTGTQAPGDKPGTTDPAAKVASISVVASNAELPSSGLPGSEVTITALLKTADNVAVSGAAVSFAADSGFLAVANATSDASGKAIAQLSTGGNKQNRPITVSVRAGSQAGTVVVNVTGTRLDFSLPATMQLGSSSTVTARLLDSAGKPIAGESVTVSASGASTATLAQPVTDASGQVALRVAASARGSGTVGLSALGATASRALTVTGAEATLLPAVQVDASGKEVPKEFAVGTCVAIDGSATTAGSVTWSTSRGALYRDAACSQPVAGPLAYGGTSLPRVYLKYDHTGVASIDAVLSGGGRGSTSIEYVAPLRAGATVSVQPDLAVVGSGERATLVAVVRDGTTANNLVKGATVQFSIVADPSGGNLLTPLAGVTGSDGVARAVYVAGPGDSGKNATIIQAQVQELPAASASTALTVNKKAISIQFGTGNKLVAFTPAVLQQDHAVFVSDSAGNPVKDVAISAAAWPVAYRKGHLEWVPTEKDRKVPGRWVAREAVTCLNEDVARKGLYEAAFDRNGNGVLDPGIPLTVVSSGKTDAMGLATVSLRYPADRANWVVVELTVTGLVAGTESSARHSFLLAGLASDYTDYNVAPPGSPSPYGIVGSCASTD